MPLSGVSHGGGPATISSKRSRPPIVCRVSVCQVAMAAQPGSAAAVATPAIGSGASRQYWGRAGRAGLWEDINVDEYTSGRCRSMYTVLSAPSSCFACEVKAHTHAQDAGMSRLVTVRPQHLRIGTSAYGFSQTAWRVAWRVAHPHHPPPPPWPQWHRQLEPTTTRHLVAGCRVHLHPLLPMRRSGSRRRLGSVPAAALGRPPNAGRRHVERRYPPGTRLRRRCAYL